MRDSKRVSVIPMNLLAQIELPKLQRYEPPTELPSLANEPYIAIDTEASGLNPFTGDKLLGWSIASPSGWSAYIPIAHDGGGNLDEKRVVEWAKKELGDYSGIVAGANIIFDKSFLATKEIYLKSAKKIVDIQVMESCLNEHRESFSLESICQDYLGEGKFEVTLNDAAKIYGISDVKANISKIHAGYVGDYARMDAVRTLQVFVLQQKRIEQEGLESVCDMECRLIPPLFAMKQNGVRVDLEYSERFRSELITDRDFLLKKIKHIAGPKAELRAPSSLISALRARGLNPPTTAKSGQPSITAGWMNQHEDDELVKLILDGRKIDTILNTFVESYIFGNAVNGRIHSEFIQTKGEHGGAIGGRLASRNPNLQNIPARDPVYGPKVRRCYVPEPKHFWASADLSQIEWRFLVHHAVGYGSDEARYRYNHDPTTDFHVMCGDIAGMNANDAFERKKVKTVNFCAVYGGGVSKLAQTLGCSEEEARIFKNKYDRKLPFVAETFQAAMREAEKYGFVLTASNRKQRFQKDASGVYKWVHAALNRKLQGGAAEYIKAAIVKAWEAGIQDVLGPPLATVHDEIDQDVGPEKIHQEALAELRHIMETAIALRVPVTVDVKLGTNWGFVND